MQYAKPVTIGTTTILIMGLLIAWGGAGLAQPAAPAEPEHPSDPGRHDAITAVYEAVGAKLVDGEIDAALNLIAATLAEMPAGQARSALFAESLQILLMNDRREEAQELYIAAMTGDPQSAVFVHGMIEHAIESSDGTAALLPWLARIFAADPPAELKLAYVRVELYALVQEHLMDDALLRLDVLMPQIPPDPLAQIVAFQVNRLMREAERRDDAERLHQWLETGARAGQDAFRLPAALLQADLIMVRDRWDELPDAARRAMALLDDRDAANRLNYWCRGALRAGHHAVTDRMAEQALEKHQRYPATASSAARWRLAVLKEQGDIDSALDRFKELALGEKLTAAQLPTLINWMSMTVLNDATPAQSRRFLEVSDALPWATIDPEERDQHRGMLLDISFSAGDFDRMETLIKAGIPDYDEEWHATMLNKVHAHQAQEAGRTDEAVQRFRLFMDQLAAGDQEDLIDPVTGHKTTASMIQALNARRIGDILLEAGRTAEAAAAHAEALEWYQRAIEEVGADSREAIWIRERIEELNAQPDDA